MPILGLTSHDNRNEHMMVTYLEADALPLRNTGQIRLYGKDDFEGMRKAYRLTARCLDELADIVRPGVPTETIDRFGPLPEPAKTLYKISALKLRAKALGIQKIDAGPAGGYILFGEDSKVDPRAVIKLLQQDSKRYRMEGQLKLRFGWIVRTEAERFTAIERLLDSLSAS